MPSDKPASLPPSDSGGPPAHGWKEVPVDWEALEDAFENNAPEVHSYLHVPTGDVLRIVDGIADPQMHARIAADQSYLRIEPVSSREQYRWMERYIPMVEDQDLRAHLTRAIDGKGAFRRFKDVLMGHGPERERWFAFRSERLRIFMEAWLGAHAMSPVPRPAWAPELALAEEDAAAGRGEPREERRTRSAESLRRQLRDVVETLGPRDLETLAAFGEFLRSRRAGRGHSQPGQPGPAAPEPDAGAEPDADDGAEPAGMAAPARAPAIEGGPVSEQKKAPSGKAPAPRRRAAAS
ncbi:MAG: hypothetical protein HY744_13925 [Deltaproteobacteria bacterium]|nr:hypothetical protein [Deltaproteobacteria bacterium]